MKNQAFLIFILALTVVFALFYGEMRAHFLDPRPLEAKVKLLSREVERAGLRAELARAELQEFRQEVASKIPEISHPAMKGEKAYAMRSLASVLREEGSEFRSQQLASLGFNKAKDLFRKDDFANAIPQFEALIRDYSFSVHIPEALFLLSEAQYQTGQFESAVSSIQRLVDQFPGHELSGYAMIRLGRIFESQNRYDEAMQIYRTVLMTFPDRAIASQAERAMKGVEP